MSIALLVCDDSRMARKQVIHALPAFGEYQITEANNGLVCLDIIKQQEVGLLFLDLTMPELDGVGVLEALKQQQFPGFVIVVSADIQPQMKARVEALGALHFFHKPVNSSALAQLLKTYGLY